MDEEYIFTEIFCLAQGCGFFAFHGSLKSMLSWIICVGIQCKNLKYRIGVCA